MNSAQSTFVFLSVTSTYLIPFKGSDGGRYWQPHIFHVRKWLKHRIEAHICISFTAYCIYKELERALYKEKVKLVVEESSRAYPWHVPNLIYTPRIKTYQITTPENGWSTIWIISNYIEIFLGCPISGNRTKGFVPGSWYIAFDLVKVGVASSPPVWLSLCSTVLEASQAGSLVSRSKESASDFGVFFFVLWNLFHRLFG